MTHLKDFMSGSMFYEILCSLDYNRMDKGDKQFIQLLYEKYQKDKENMELSINQYARLNDIDFMQPEYIYEEKFIKHLTP